jgi:hypothetical protein
MSPATAEETVPVAAIAERELVSAHVPIPVSEPAPGPVIEIVESSVAASNGLYRITDLSPFAAAPERFYEFGYRDALRGMIDAVIQTEGPLRTDILCQRIARAHGWLRTGGKIRERIDLHLRDYDRTGESSGEFIWKKGAVADVHPYRAPESEDARRAIGDIPLAELTWIVSENPGLLDEPDPSREMARLLGVERLVATSRARLDEAIATVRISSQE